MRQNPRLFRLTATVAIGALLCNPVLQAAMAQPASTPPAAQAAPSEQNQADPPARVGRIASQSGAVSFRTTADTQWSAAAPNYPVSSGNAFWTEPTARAQLDISASRVDLSGQTEFDVTNLADSGLESTAPQGELYLHLADLAPNEVWSVQTPRGTVRLTAAGRYGIVAGTTDQPTQVTVLEGAADIEGPGVALTVAANQTATVTGTDTFQGTVGPAVRDAFLAARLAAERPPPRPVASVAAQLTYMSGAEDLAGYGEWSQAPDYGEVWYPPVAAGWVPYREGEWAYVAPWGWTWVDSAPWGFAPFHYGRWAHIGGRWGWIPGEARVSERPVWSPALVAFIGISAGVAVGVAIANRPVGWVPLGPGEAYHPWYHASPNYVRQINTGHVKDVTTISNSVTINDFANRAAATSVPASVMLGSHNVRAAARPISAQALASAQPVIGQQPIRPTPATLGVTPAVARQLNLPAGGREGAPGRPAPGPVVRVQEPGAATGAPPRPPLIGPPGILRPGEPAAGQGPGHVPGGPPPLPTTGTRPGGLPEPGQARPQGRSPEVVMPPGVRPEGETRPGTGPEILRPSGPPPLPAPGTRPEAVPEPGQVRPPGGPPATTRPTEVRPEGVTHPEPGREPANRLPAIQRPTPPPRPAAPEPPAREAPPHVMAPEPPRPAPPPPRAEPPRPAPPPRAEPPRAAPPPPRAEPPPRPRAEPEKKPGEH